MITLTITGGTMKIEGFSDNPHYITSSKGTFSKNTQNEYTLKDDTPQKNKYFIGLYTNVSGMGSDNELENYLSNFFGNAVPALVDRVTAIENLNFKIAYYVEITNVSGTITVPTGSTILLDQWPAGKDAETCAIPGGTGTPPDFIATSETATLTGSGNYTVSSLVTDPAALVFYLSVPLKYYGNLSQSNIIELALLESVNDLSNVIYVAPYGGDFTSIKSALDSITDSSSSNRYAVLVAPAIYTESNPIQGKEYVTVKALGDLQTTRIEAGNGSQNLFTMAQFFTLQGFTFWGVTGASNYAIYQGVSGLTSLTRCAFAECSNGLYLNHSGANMSLDDVGAYNLTVTTTDCIRVDAGVLTAQTITASLGNITNFIKLDGANTRAILNNIVSLISTVGIAVCATNQAEVDINGTKLDGMTDGCVFDGGSHIHLNNISIENAQQDGVRIDDVGVNTDIKVQNCIIANSTRYDINILSATAIVTGNARSSLNKLNYKEGAKIYGYILDLQEDDEGVNFIGEVRIGLAGQGAELSAGEGDSYVRGMKVYAFDGTSYVDISSTAASASGSTFTFPNTNVNTAFYIASSLENTDKLRHHGIKTKIATAIVTGTSGEVVTEYWNGSAWVEFNSMEAGTYPHAKQYFERTGSYQIRYDYAIQADWTKNDPVSFGTNLYWVRFRIKVAITTSPVIEQFKLHTNRLEVNSNGTLENFGGGRPLIPIFWNLGLLEAANDSPTNQDIYIGDFLAVGRKENSFSPTLAQRVGFSSILPLSTDTSSGLFFAFAFRTDDNSAGNAVFKIRWAWLKHRGGVYGGTTLSPTDAVNQQDITITEEVFSPKNQLQWVSRVLDISNMRCQISGDYPDMFFLSLERTGTDISDTHTGNISLVGVDALVVAWRQGGFI